ncbi:MAG: thiol peroxidase [Phycisphaerales bacterium]|nr:thiol peroxidase [Phycisphaerales bacterium]
MSERAGLVTLKGNPIKVSGPGIKVGDKAPDFKVTANDLSTKTLADCAGKVVILSSVPSLDTAVCDKSTRKFNEDASKVPGVVIVTVSRDLPFAQKRWCGAAGIQNVMTLSDFRDHSFGKAYGYEITDGALAGLLARAIVVIDKTGVIRYEQIVPEIAQEPDYDKALAVAKGL